MESINIQELYNKMLLNPSFAKFVEDNKSKSIEELAMEYDIKILKEQDVQKFQY